MFRKTKDETETKQQNNTRNGFAFSKSKLVAAQTIGMSLFVLSNNISAQI